MTDDDEDSIKAYPIDKELLQKPSEEIIEELEENRSDIRGVERNLSETNKLIGSIKSELEEINQTIESNERHIHIFPPDSNISSPLVSFELTLAAFALVLPLIQFLQGNQVNELSVAIGAALFVHPVLSFIRNR